MMIKWWETFHGIETICQLALTDKLKQCTISIPSPFDEDDNLNFYASVNRNPSIKVYTPSNSSPYVKINLKLIGRLLSFNNNEKEITQDMIYQIEEEASQYITKQVYDYLYKTSKEYNSDVVGIRKLCYT